MNATVDLVRTSDAVALGVEDCGDPTAPLVLLVGAPTMLSWPDELCESLARNGRHVVRRDLRDAGTSTTENPEDPAYTLRDMAADAVALLGYWLAGQPSWRASRPRYGARPTWPRSTIPMRSWSPSPAPGQSRRVRSTTLCTPTSRSEQYVVDQVRQQYPYCCQVGLVAVADGPGGHLVGRHIPKGTYARFGVRGTAPSRAETVLFNVLVGDRTGKSITYRVALGVTAHGPQDAARGRLPRRP